MKGLNHKEKATQLFLSGYNCAQAVFAAFSDVMGIDEKTALKLSSSFGGGMGQMGEVCGAVSGMFMVAGAIFGYDDSGDPELKKEHYKLIRELADEFKVSYPTIICRELLKDLGEGKYSICAGEAKENYKKRPCLIFVERAAEILDKRL